MRDLLTAADLSPQDAQRLLNLAELYVHDPGRTPYAVENQLVVLWFGTPSTHTRVSLDAAVVQLGGVPTTITGCAEPVEDTAGALSAYGSVIVTHGLPGEDLSRLAAAATVPVLDALPLRSLADVLTLRQLFDDLGGRHLAYVGPGDGVAVSLAQAAALAGVDVVLATPEECPPAAAGVAAAGEIATATGSSVLLTRYPRAAVAEASAVYAGRWPATGDPAPSVPPPFRVDGPLLSLARPEAVVLHELPPNRDREGADELVHGPRSRVFQQAANRRPLNQAALYTVLQGKGESPGVR
ncbi:ornithine carbamoyltransferase [Prauserella flavalba]|uniref:Ornithine carbamoyltransferase n=1 Tax=Prauserella flavalba TaxID=1477506 RepID=A0A318MCB7_9PSEU|nr:ornithine carbamoyltransferase [Prauserella flavalba]PXY36509.1 hypothetical protein BA062_14065 [Prauserella flavalba]